jgi:hypothetical protein
MALTCVVAEAGDGVGIVGDAPSPRLTAIERLDVGDALGSLLELVRQRIDEPPPLGCSDVGSPARLERAAGRGDGEVDVRVGGRVEPTEQLFGGRVDRLERLAVAGDPGSVDIEACRNPSRVKREGRHVSWVRQGDGGWAARRGSRVRTAISPTAVGLTERTLRL